MYLFFIILVFFWFHLQSPASDPIHIPAGREPQLPTPTYEFLNTPIISQLEKPTQDEMASDVPPIQAEPIVVLEDEMSSNVPPIQAEPIVILEDEMSSNVPSIQAEPAEPDDEMANPLLPLYTQRMTYTQMEDATEVMKGSLFI